MRPLTFVISVCASVALASRLAAQTPSGAWEGIARVPGQGTARVNVAFDSAASGWHGTLHVPGQMPAPVPFATVERIGDSVVARLSEQGQHVVFRFALSADGRRMAGGVDIDNQHGSIEVARPGSAESSSLLAALNRAERSRVLAADLVKASPPAKVPSPNPDSALLITSDIKRFWDVLDRAPHDSLGDYLQRDYLERGSVGVRDFVAGRILSAEDLATYVNAHRATYDSVRAANLDVTRAEAAIRAAFRRLKTLYPDAVFPDVYFVIGRFNSGGTSTSHGLLIGAEMYRDPARLPAIVSHELIHFQQHYSSPTLLEASFMEGSADFVGELISGQQINSEAYKYGIAHEAELWKEFTAHFDDRNFFPWMYGKPGDGRPNDLGYFIGYRIAQAYYARATDKDQALRDIITARGGNVRELLRMSGYNP